MNGKMFYAESGEFALGYFFAATPAAAKYMAAKEYFALEGRGYETPGDYLMHIRVLRAPALDSHGKSIRINTNDSEAPVWDEGLAGQDSNGENRYFPTLDARSEWERDWFERGEEFE